MTTKKITFKKDQADTFSAWKSRHHCCPVCAKADCPFCGNTMAFFENWLETVDAHTFRYSCRICKNSWEEGWLHASHSRVVSVREVTT